ncbi:GNAT family N-acetyltransferase [Nocardia sp. NPDC057030]|uniref:GNAT family N-acetyltransferase n=1 Tax=unclassified Nocardia TaxID=2637762 RepID=UPI00363F2FAC
MTATSDLIVSELIEPDSLGDPIALYRDVFALRPEDPAPSSRLLTALARNGSIALGARKNGELVGFSYGFPGLDLDGGGRIASIYHYMELLVVRADQQSTGIGRALMQFLRGSALTRGLRTIQWAYDPLRAANAYFYLDVLGARGCGFAPNLYGIEDSGRDRGHPTDRIITRWELAKPALRWPQPPSGLTLGSPEPDPRGDTGAMLVAIPTEYEDPCGIDCAALRCRIAAVLGDLIASGFQAVSCRKAGGGTSVYRLVPGTAHFMP